MRTRIKTFTLSAILLLGGGCQPHFHFHVELGGGKGVDAAPAAQLPPPSSQPSDPNCPPEEVQSLEDYLEHELGVPQ